MNCPKCNSKNRDGAKFCLSCGFHLMEDDTSSKTPDSPDLKKDENKPAPPASHPPSPPVAGTPSSPDNSPKVLPLPKTLWHGRYNVIAELGAGNMGRVILAEDTMMDFPVVIKEMLPNFSDSKDRQYKEKRFKEEARILFRLKHHNVPRLTEFFTENGSMYLVMEYVEGENLQKILKNRPGKQIEIEEAVKWMSEILGVLSYVHNQDPPILHRDIKPPNIMIAKDGTVLLVDFGIARTLGDSTSYTHIGTPGFASLDHYTGNFSPSSDIYSLGATFHYMLTGSNPRSRKEFDFPVISKYRDDVPPELDKVLKKMLELKPKNRYQQASEVLEDIAKMKKRQKEDEEKEKSVEIDKDEQQEQVKLSQTSSTPVKPQVSPVKPAGLPASVSPQKSEFPAKLIIIGIIIMIIVAIGAFFLGKSYSTAPGNSPPASPAVTESSGFIHNKIIPVAVKLQPENSVLPCGGNLHIPSHNEAETFRFPVYRVI